MLLHEGIVFAVGVTDQADIWLDDQPEASGFRGGAETGRRNNDAGDDRNVSRNRRTLPADADQDTLPVQPPRYLQGS